MMKRRVGGLFALAGYGLSGRRLKPTHSATHITVSTVRSLRDLIKSLSTCSIRRPIRIRASPLTRR